MNGATVTFAAPGSGASGTFAGGATTATTNASGVATAAVFTANAIAGSYTVTASVSGVSTPANFSLTNLAASLREFRQATRSLNLARRMSDVVPLQPHECFRVWRAHSSPFGPPQKSALLVRLVSFCKTTAPRCHFVTFSIPLLYSFIIRPEDGAFVSLSVLSRLLVRPLEALAALGEAAVLGSVPNAATRYEN